MTSADHEFEKFREKKINEKAAAQHDADAAFFGTFKKKEEPEEDGPKKIRLDDLNLPEKERPDNVPKVGESLKLIDIALESTNAAGAVPQKVGPSHVQPNAPPRPGTKPMAGAKPPAPARPKPGTAPAPRATQKPTPRATPAPATPPPTRTWGAPPARAGGAPKPGAPTPPPAAPAKPKPAARRPGSQPLSGFQDKAHESGPHEVIRQDQFEDTTFVEATDHEDPYEFRDKGGDSGLDLVDDPADAAKPRQGSGRNPVVKKPGGAGASGRNKAVKPPVDPKSKTATNRSKRPFGR